MAGLARSAGGSRTIANAPTPAWRFETVEPGLSGQCDLAPDADPQSGPAHGLLFAYPAHPERACSEGGRTLGVPPRSGRSG